MPGDFNAPRTAPARRVPPQQRAIHLQQHERSFAQMTVCRIAHHRFIHHSSAYARLSIQYTRSDARTANQVRGVAPGQRQRSKRSGPNSRERANGGAANERDGGDEGAAGPAGEAIVPAPATPCGAFDAAGRRGRARLRGGPIWPMPCAPAKRSPPGFTAPCHRSPVGTEPAAVAEALPGASQGRGHADGHFCRRVKWASALASTRPERHSAGLGLHFDSMAGNGDPTLALIADLLPETATSAAPFPGAGNAASAMPSVPWRGLRAW